MCNIACVWLSDVHNNGVAGEYTLVNLLVPVRTCIGVGMVEMVYAIVQMYRIFWCM